MTTFTHKTANVATFTHKTANVGSFTHQNVSTTPVGAYILMSGGYYLQQDGTSHYLLNGTPSTPTYTHITVS